MNNLSKENIIEIIRKANNTITNNEIEEIIKKSNFKTYGAKKIKQLLNEITVKE